jgi:hypothetical protein
MSRKSFSKSLPRAIFPTGVFLIVWIIHYIWLGLFPESNAVQSQWAPLEGIIKVSWWQQYIKTQGYYLGFTYALSLTFAFVALRRYREQRLCQARNLAVGGITLSGFFAVAGCYLLGCCGSPMLAVYMSLFGAAFLPLAKPLIAALTAILIGVAWWWMNRVSACLVSSQDLDRSTEVADPQ